MFSNRRTAVHAGHSLSKDWSAGIVALQWLHQFGPEARVIITGPTFRQVKEITFQEIEKHYLQLMRLFPKQYRSDWLKTTHLEFGPGWEIIGFTTNSTADVRGKSSGFHSPNMLVIITEAEGISHEIFAEMNTLMTSSNSRLLEIGNPLLEYGDFYEHCTNPRFGYNVIHLSCLDSPNVVEKKEIVPGLVTSEYVEQTRMDCGPDYKDDPYWQAHILGVFPQQSRNAWILLSKIKEAVGRQFPEDHHPVVAGVDTARQGNDETVFCIFKGRRMIRQECFRKMLGPGTVGWAREIFETEKVEMFGIDIGFNPSILDWINEERIPTCAVNFGAESPDERFENLATYIWHLAREAFMNGDISIIDDPILVSQLSSRRVEMTARGKRRLESKKVSGMKSPDRADALVIAWYMRMMAMGSYDSVSGGAETDAEKLERIFDRVSTPVENLSAVAPVRDEFAEERSYDDVSAGDSDASKLDF